LLRSLPPSYRTELGIIQDRAPIMLAQWLELMKEDYRSDLVTVRLEGEVTGVEDPLRSRSSSLFYVLSWKEYPTGPSKEESHSAVRFLSASDPLYCSGSTRSNTSTSGA
jgi:hypothetical protein